MRSKADALDYRYFPEPDLPALHIDASFIDAASNNLVGSTYTKMKRYKDEYSFNKEFINGLISYKDINDLFESLVVA
jgi:aspartyl-tRNA(Asn)/glutamyl-tRNA(Gln) amidotransferase subunit B